MPGLFPYRAGTAVETTASRRTGLSERAFFFMTAVVVVQGGHVIEHIVQLIQVLVFGVADDDALGLLGYVLQFNGTEEWLHLGYNALYLISLYLLIVPLWRITPAVLPVWAFGVFIAASVWIESWHMVEHGVIISHVIANGGCPCPGIGDRALGVSDTILHFLYNAVAYAGIIVAFAFVMRARGHRLRLPNRLHPREMRERAARTENSQVFPLGSSEAYSGHGPELRAHPPSDERDAAPQSRRV